MRKFVLCVVFTLVITLFASSVQAGYVKGYYRRDGTYIRPHYRSNPDGVKWNNYGSPSSSQKRQYRNYPVLPSYRYDYDSDGIPNRYDLDDNNNGIHDDWEN
jgi:hypothetical protein